MKSNRMRVHIQTDRQIDRDSTQTERQRIEEKRETEAGAEAEPARKTATITTLANHVESGEKQLPHNEI